MLAILGPSPPPSQPRGIGARVFVSTRTAHALFTTGFFTNLLSTRSGRRKVQMSADAHFDIVVIGGGIIGCSSAFWLARRGLKVALVERARIGHGTTGNSFAWINGTSKSADEAYHRLNALGLSVYRELATEFGEDCLGLNPSGMLKLVSRCDESAYASTREQAARLAAFGYPGTWIGNAELAAMEPHLKLDGDVEALYAMADACLDAPAFARFMAQQARALGALVREECAASSLEMTDDGAITAVLTAQGRLQTPRVLVTAGPATPELLSELTGYDGFAARFPLNRVPGLLVVTPSTAPRRLVRRVLYMAGGDEFHVLPTPDGGLKVGADDTDGMVADNPTPARMREAASILLERTRALIPAFDGAACLERCRVGIGVRPYPRDGKTLAGELPGSQGLFVIATHSGVTLSPALGRLMAELIAEGRTPQALAPFALERFQAFA
jgi:glycine/D-amino acid oxidase-like deaminating enzyme